MAMRTVTWLEWQERIKETTLTCSRETRMEIMRKLLGNLSRDGIRNVQTMLSHEKRKRKKPGRDVILPETTEFPIDDEQAYYELNEWEHLVNWAACADEKTLLGYIHVLLANFRTLEVSQVCSSYCYHAREAKLYPERVASRRKSVPTQVGWWEEYAPYEENIFSMDCEFVSQIVGRKQNGKPRCRQLAGTVSIADFKGKIVYKWTIKHKPEDIYMTPTAKKITGMDEHSFVNGTELSEVKGHLDSFLDGKLLILLGGGMDLDVLGYGEARERQFDVFDLHQYYRKETGAIGLRSLVHHYYGIDIQSGVHDSDVDAIYTMKLFREQYIPIKLANPAESKIREGNALFNEIKTIK